MDDTFPATRARIFRSAFAAVCALAIPLAGAGCERGGGASGDVVGVFGGVGLAPGDFSYPRTIAAEPSGSVLVIDKNGRLQRFTEDGEFVELWRMPEIAKGKPVGVTAHPDGRIFVADTHYSRVLVFDHEGKELARFGSHGTGDGEFLLPTDVAIDAKGRVYVSEYQGNDRVTRWTPDYEFERVITPAEIDGSIMRRPAAIDIDDEQTLWIADACNHRIIHLTLDGEVLRVFGSFGTEPGQMRYPYGLTVTAAGEVLVCEYEGNRLQWFSPDGKSLRIWGKPGRAPGELFAPWDVTVAKSGLVYVVDALNSRVQIIRP